MKGQAFSIDLLFAMGLIVLCFGILSAGVETRMYETKESFKLEELREKTQTAQIVLTNSEMFSCDLNGISIPYSLNESKLNSIPASQLKQILGLPDQNIQATSVELTPMIIINEEINSKNVISYESKILICNNDTNISDLISCMNGICPAGKIKFGTVTLRVGE